ncbi:MAG: filamentous hemagglutinin N-terminal domain-containing protein [Thermovirgaceae bacterium]|nr:filamentous hemagglutinin N-terminal domain-containing protein [Thermovirgaceae bacterium]
MNFHLKYRLSSLFRSSFPFFSDEAEVVHRLPPGPCILFILLLACLVFLSPVALSASVLPEGGVISAGNGSISQTDTDMTINQTSENMIIDWQGFSIGPGNSVTFDQPSSSATALNRVISSEVSNIQGALKANGRVFLINQSGVIFSSTAQVNVGDLVVSTLNISNDDFMSGNYTFSGGSPGNIVNRGDISAAGGGYVVMIAARIENTGTITASSGGVLMGAGSRVVLDLGGAVKLEVEEAAIDALIEQGGAIRADGGLVYISAKAAGDLSSTVINHTGITEARTIATGEKGEIYLMGGMKNDRIVVGGTLDASAPEGDGGFIETSAATVRINDDVKVTTKAEGGKTGTWLIDPKDFTIAASGGDATGAAISTSLATNNLTIESTAGSQAGNGDIFVNDSITWFQNTLTLNAWRNIEINRELFGSGSAKLALYFGQGAAVLNNAAACSINAPVNLPAGYNFSTRLGNDSIVKNYYVITELGVQNDTTKTTLQGMKNKLNGYYALGSDIDASPTAEWDDGKGFDPVGNYLNSNANYRFSGSFDGLGHAISGLTINRPDSNFIGLFGYTTAAEIRNVGIKNGKITGNNYVGGLAAYLSSNSVVTSSYANVEVVGKGDNYTGGLVGFATGSEICNSFTSGSVIGSGKYVGGLVGLLRTSSVVESSFSSAAVTGTENVGGLVGNCHAGSTITNSFAEGDVSSSVGSVGGFVGYLSSSSTIINSWSSGRISGPEGNPTAGGFIGKTDSSENTITNSYWDTETSLQPASAGGTGKTTDDMKKLSTFKDSDDGWNISSRGGEDTIWRVYEGCTYPLLRAFFKDTATITPGSVSKVYDGATVFAGSCSLEAGKESGYVHGMAEYHSADKNVGQQLISLTGLYSDQLEYDLIFDESAIVSINPKTLTLAGTFTADDKTYDGNTTAAISNNSLTAATGVGTETLGVTDLVAAFADKKAADNTTVNLTGAVLQNGDNGGLASNYELDIPGSEENVRQTTADITPRAVGATADAKSKEENQSDPPLTYQVEAQNGDRGLVTGENLAGDLTRENGEALGDYEIRPGTVVNENNPNYSIQYTPADLAITKNNDGLVGPRLDAVQNAQNAAAGFGGNLNPGGGLVFVRGSGNPAGAGEDDGGSDPDASGFVQFLIVDSGIRLPD